MVFDYPESESEPFGQWASLWRGLRDLGLLDVAEHPGSDMQWRTPTRICAEWMLMSPHAATGVNRAYDRVNPQALQHATGLSEDELFDPEQWARKLLGSPRPHPRPQSRRERWTFLSGLVPASLTQRTESRRPSRSTGSVTGPRDAP